MPSKTFTLGERVSFMPGPKSTSSVSGTVKDHSGQFLVVACEDGRERKIRPGSCTAA